MYLSKYAYAICMNFNGMLIELIREFVSKFGYK